MVVNVANDPGDVVRIICLVKNSIYPYVSKRRDLMSNEYPSIWLEITGKVNQKSLLLAGFYRGWNSNGETS